MTLGLWKDANTLIYKTIAKNIFVVYEMVGMDSYFFCIFNVISIVTGSPIVFYLVLV